MVRSPNLSSALGLTMLLALSPMTSTGQEDPAACQAVVEGPFNVAELPTYTPRSVPRIDQDVVDEEWFVACQTGESAYRTSMRIRRPADPEAASGIVVVEPTHPGNLWPVQSTSHDYLVDRGHVSVAIHSSSFVVERFVKPAAPQRYAALAIPEVDNIESDILAQLGRLLKTEGVAGVRARTVILAGYSNTAGKVRRYIETSHLTQRLADGSPIYDGYFPGQTAVGTFPTALPDVDVPVLELQGEREVIATLERNPGGLTYRRPDSDSYRLWEVPAMSHLDTSDPERRSFSAESCGIEAPATLSTFPLSQLWHAALDALIVWSSGGPPAPRANRIELEPDGRTLRRDEHGNAEGGVPTLHNLVPRATYTSIHERNPESPSARCDMIGSELEFSRQKLIELYGTYGRYRDASLETLAELERDRYSLPLDRRRLLVSVDRMRGSFGPGNPPEASVENKRPVFGGACKTCPWGVVGEFVKEALAPYGYDVQICYHCARSEAPRIVAAGKEPPPWRGGIPTLIPDEQIPLPPNGAVAFGATSVKNAFWAFEGSHQYSGEAPRSNLRLLGALEAPSYLLVAARSELRLHDLGELRQKRWPVRILGRKDDEILDALLAHYGLSSEEIEAAGGSIVRGSLPSQQEEFDLIIQDGTLGNAPEYNLWTILSQRYDLDFLELPEALVDELATRPERQRQTVPVGLFRGIDRPIPTVARSGHAVYCRDDLPEDFAYLVAKAMDEQQGLLQWRPLPFSYNRHTVWQALGLPLHPGAVRYYREQGFMP